MFSGQASRRALAARSRRLCPFAATNKQQQCGAKDQHSGGTLEGRSQTKTLFDTARGCGANSTCKTTDHVQQPIAGGAEFGRYKLAQHGHRIYVEPGSKKTDAKKHRDYNTA